MRFWQSLPNPPNVNLNGGFGGVYGPTTPLSPYILPATYTGIQPGQDLGPAIAKVFPANPIAPFSMILGWQAGNDLLKADKAYDDQRLTKAAWRLINSRYGFERIGRITGFTLQYMSGFAINERFIQIANNPGTAPPSITDQTKLANQLAQTPTFVQSKNFLMSFSKILTGEYYAVASNTGIRDPKVKQILLTEYYYFILGFNSGVIRASDDLFAEIGSSAYLAGWEQGFRDGFSAGYTAGWAAGYAVGYQTAWAQAQVTITQLQNTISSLQSQLSQAQQSGGGGCDFWCVIGQDGSGIASVIGGIASLF